MSVIRTDTQRTQVDVQATHQVQAPPPASPFKDVLNSGAGFLIAGAAVATSVVGGPVLAAAVRGIAPGPAD